MFLLFLLEVHLRSFPSTTLVSGLNVLFPVGWIPSYSSYIPTGTDGTAAEVIPVFYIHQDFAGITFLGERAVLELSLLIPCHRFT